MLSFLRKFRPKSIDFIYVFLEDRKLSPFYCKIINSISNKTVYKASSSSEYSGGNDYFLIFDVPGYLSTIPHPIVSKKKINTFKGSFVNLNLYKNFNHFMKSKFNAKRRSQYRNHEKRLLHCFDISHKFYFGDITKKEYDTLFEKFYVMLEERFLEKGIANDDVKHWNHIRKVVFPLIQKKEALLSVLYNDDEPISISLNIVHDKIIYGYMKSHNINFSKFSIGFLELIRTMKWAFDNDFQVFDFLKGQYDYKSKWIDDEYYFEKQILYNSQSLVMSISASIVAIRIRFFYTFITFLKKLRVDKAYKKYKSGLYKIKGKGKNEKENITISVEKYSDIKSKEEKITVDINKEPYNFLKKTVYDFLFIHNEYINDVEVYRLLANTNHYIIKGKLHSQKVTCKL